MQEADEPPSPLPDDVRAQLERIVDSVEFAVSERARRFLRYVVGEALAGHGERIKAYTIAVEVLGRDEGFDANADPAVRLEAGRLRRALERYYLVAGQADPALIGIPKGGYVPTFAAHPRGNEGRRVFLPDAIGLGNGQGTPPEDGQDDQLAALRDELEDER